MAVVNCPQCGDSVEWTPENRYRPFCSKRCKLIDLGAWASESYSVPATPNLDDDLGEINTPPQ
ncbi:DNA gyrase inhibitor YacG [Ampullimonas aquatilis]|uniref:DNA gyrase inhibitor YacG n=1 Tax=Ampullimonas aquatilis TaxID=1341549 RepID=UPI003C709E12